MESGGRRRRRSPGRAGGAAVRPRSSLRQLPAGRGGLESAAPRAGQTLHPRAPRLTRTCGARARPPGASGPFLSPQSARPFQGFRLASPQPLAPVLAGACAASCGGGQSLGPWQRMGFPYQGAALELEMIEYQAVPRYGPASPFKGHLSTKSNAFCIDSSSRRLNNQYLIRDHMAVHYNKILQARAAVDCSVPKSRLNSIKFSDQQRREKLKKEIERCEKEINSSKDVSRSNSRESRRPLSATYRKNSLETEGNVGQSLGAPGEQKSVPSHLSTPEKQSTDFPGPEKLARREGQKTSNISVSSISTSSLHRLHSKASASSSSDSIANKPPPKVQNAESKSNSGDLLDKHSEHFTSNQQPFTPRTLKSDAKSYLSQYRYYMPAKRKTTDIPKQHVEAETQTDISRSGKKDEDEFQKIIMQMEDKVSPNEDKSDEGQVVSQLSSPSVTSPGFAESPTMRRIQAEEEELLYLNFIQDITDEILRLGLFSNRALERLFERHIEQNKNHLEETKMRHLLEILKVDLGCTNENYLGEPATFGLRQNEPAENLQHPDDTQRQSKPASKNEEILKAIDFIANEQAEPKSLVCSEKSQKVESKDGFSKNLSEPVPIGPDPSSFVTKETPDTSCMLPPTLDSTTCDADFEMSESLREVDDLQESFAESLHLSTDNAQQ
ncbi:spermatogenesis-associated protein 7 [Tiliqua scincoides]|uniref:spermatogenesis-associated protein 7 n=1 Tax=Tiliqua scincoides TaxID=71010 RepID=UPI003461FCF5